MVTLEGFKAEDEKRANEDFTAVFRGVLDRKPHSLESFQVLG
jgi:hypothetical protein